MIIHYNIISQNNELLEYVKCAIQLNVKQEGKKIIQKKKKSSTAFRFQNQSTSSSPDACDNCYFYDSHHKICMDSS